MTQIYLIREAHTGEAGRIADIQRDSAQKYVSQPGFENYLVGFVARPEKYVRFIADGRVLVAVNEWDWPIGFSAVGDMDEAAYLAELCVAPDHQGNGLGRRLIEAATVWAREQGYLSLLLSTFREIPWNAPYERQGFRIVPSTELGRPGIARQRAHEAQFLDISKRVFMRKAL